MSENAPGKQPLSEWQALDAEYNTLRMALKRADGVACRAIAFGRLFTFWRRIIEESQESSCIQCWQQVAELLPDRDSDLAVLAWISMTVTRLPEGGREYMSIGFLEYIPENPEHIDLLLWLWNYRKSNDEHWVFDYAYRHLSGSIDAHMQYIRGANVSEGK